jgi:Zn finger protein HypA/HybF involved in hydrogenase expression
MEVHLQVPKVLCSVGEFSCHDDSSLLFKLELVKLQHKCKSAKWSYDFHRYFA